MAAKIREQLPEQYRYALDDHLQALPRPESLLGELQAVHTGLHGPGYGYDVIGRALHELAVAGGRLTPSALRGFCRRIAEGDPPPRLRGAGRQNDDDWDFAAAARRLEEEEEEERRVQARV